MRIKQIIAIIVLIFAAIAVVFSCTGCTEAERASYNLSQEADNFNVVRKLTIIDCITGDTMFQCTGKMSITADVEDNQLEIMVEDDGKYFKHFIGLSDNVTYIVEDMDVKKADISKYHYEINFNPNMWLPAKPKIVD